jgi:hypothetical protein
VTFTINSSDSGGSGNVCGSGGQACILTINQPALVPDPNQPNAPSPCVFSPQSPSPIPFPNGAIVVTLNYICGPGQSAAAAVVNFSGTSNSNFTLNPTGNAVVAGVSVGTGIVLSSLLPFACTLVNSTTMNCTVPNPVTLLSGATLQASILVPTSGVALSTTTALPGCGTATGQGTPTITYGPCSSASTAGSSLVEQVTVPIGVHTVTESTSLRCDNYMRGPAVPGDTASFTVTVANSGAGVLITSLTPDPSGVGTCGPPITSGLNTAMAAVSYSCGGTNSSVAKNLTTTGAANSAFTGAPNETTQVCCISVPPNRAAAAYILTAPGLGGPVTATITKTCTGLNNVAPMPGQTDTCTITSGDPIPVGGSAQATLQTPAFTRGTLVCTGVAGVTSGTVSGSTCIFTNISASTINPPTVVGTEVFQVAATATIGTAVTQSGVTCLDSNNPCTVVPGTCGSLSLPGSCPVTCTGSGCTIGGTPQSISKVCTGPGGAAPSPGQSDSCPVMSGATAIPVSGSLQITILSPAITPGTLLCTGIA